MSKKPVYYLDSNVLIEAKNTYYAFGICPGFWKSLIHYHSHNRIYSIDHIRRELLVGTDDLAKWVKGDMPDEFFLSTDGEDITNAFTEVMLWVQRSRQYTEPAKAKFATEADGWLVAYARVHSGIVVTNEQPRPDSKSRILLPDVCKHFKVECQSTFGMLKDLKARYDWKE